MFGKVETDPALISELDEAIGGTLDLVPERTDQAGVQLLERFTVWDLLGLG